MGEPTPNVDFTPPASHEPRNRQEKTNGDLNHHEMAKNTEAVQEPFSNDSGAVETVYIGAQMGAARRRIIMLSLCLTLFLAALDITIMSTALPTIATALRATASEYAWVGSSYTLASTSTTPVWAKTSDIFGRKPTLMAANAVFMAGSLVAALASSIEMLIGGRVLQGLGGGGMLVLVTIIIGDLFALQDRAKYYSYNALVWAVSSAVGPILGGIFTQTIGWRWCFWINLPFEGASLCVLFFFLKIDAKSLPLLEGLRSLDWIGSGLVIGGTVCFLYGLESGASGLHGWSSVLVICLLVFGVTLLALFFLYEAKLATNPIFPMAIFASTTNFAAFAIACVQSFVFIAYDYFLPLYFQFVLAFSPVISGVTLFALVIPLSLATFTTGRFIASTGNFAIVIRVGVLLTTIGTGLLIELNQDVNWPKIICFQIIVGIGVGPLFQGPMIAIQSHINQDLMAPAMAALTFMRTLFSSCSIVIGSVVLQSRLEGLYLTADHGGTGSKPAQEASNHGQETYVGALRIMWIFYTALCGLMVVSSLFIKGKLNQEGVTADLGKQSRKVEAVVNMADEKN